MIIASAGDLQRDFSCQLQSGSAEQLYQGRRTDLKNTLR
jgi:hypothetical protein